MRKPRISLKQLLVAVSIISVLAWCVGNYRSWYGVRWTQSRSETLETDLAHLGDHAITEGLAVRVAIDAAFHRGGQHRVLLEHVQRDVWTKHFENGEPVVPVDIGCYRVHLTDIPDGLSGAFTRIVGGHCTVYVGLDGTVLHFVGGA